MKGSRKSSRRSAMQAIYQWQMTGSDSSNVDYKFATDEDSAKIDQAYYQLLVREVTQRASELDAMFSPLLTRPLSEVNPVELAIMRIASYELAYVFEVPYRVVINEAIELAKQFGAEKGHQFINGIVDKLAHQLRKDEIAAKK